MPEAEGQAAWLGGATFDGGAGFDETTFDGDANSEGQPSETRGTTNLTWLPNSFTKRTVPDFSDLFDILGPDTNSPFNTMSILLHNAKYASSRPQPDGRVR